MYAHCLGQSSGCIEVEVLVKPCQAGEECCVGAEIACSIVHHGARWVITCCDGLSTALNEGTRGSATPTRYRDPTKLYQSH
jgi:hypothetical protein